MLRTTGSVGLPPVPLPECRGVKEAGQVFGLSGVQVAHPLGHRVRQLVHGHIPDAWVFSVRQELAFAIQPALM